MAFMEWIQAGGLAAIGLLVYSALSLAGQVTQLVDGPDEDPNDRPSRVKAVIDKLMELLRAVGIGARFRNEGPSNPLPLAPDTKTRIRATEKVGEK